MNLSRREFFYASAALPNLLFAKSSASEQNAEPWFRRMRRCAQHNLNEYDPQTLDIDSWMDYWESLRINALVLTAGGLMAFYPTRIPNHHKSQFLGDKDVFGEYAKRAKQRGINVVARIETNWLHQDVLQSRPDWFERDERGNPIANEETRYVFQTCLFSDYHEIQIPRIIREIGSQYNVDGYFTNSWPSTDAPQRCFCAQCQKFAGFTRAQLLEVHKSRMLELCEHLASAAKSTGTDHVYNLNIAGGIRAAQSINSLAAVGEWITSDHQGRSGGNTPIWDCSQQGRVGLSAMGSKPVTNVVTANAHNWRHTSKGRAELEMWLAQTVATGMVPWLVWMGSELEDYRWRDGAKDFYQFLAKNEVHFVNRKSMSKVGVVYSQRTNSQYEAPWAVPGGYGARASTKPHSLGDPTDHLQGLYYALLESRVVFDFVHEDNLDAQHLGRYTTLLLPNVALLSNAQCASLRTFVQSGGSLLATFETSLYDEAGKLREQFGLADVFDVERKSNREGAFFYGAKQKPHDVLQFAQGTNWLPMGEWRVPLKDRIQPVLTVVPPYPRGIPEMVYPHSRLEMPYAGPGSDEPAIALREIGKSRVAYFPSDIDRCIWKYGNTDLSELLQNAVRWVTKDDSNVKVSGDGVAEVIAWETEAGYAIHILNYNNPNMTLPWIRKHYPLGPQKATITLPGGVSIARVALLRSGTDIAFRQHGQTVEFVIPSINDYEVATLLRN